MRTTRGLLRSPKELGFRLLLLSLGALLLLSLERTGRIDPLESALAGLISPGQSTLTSITGRVAELWRGAWEFRRLQRRVAELERVNASLLVENLRLQEVERENQRLRELLQFAETRPGIQLRGAQILARPIGFGTNNLNDILILDLGRRHGIEVGMPVVSEQGLVGRISEVTDTTSKVLLITDATSIVNAILQSSRQTGVLRGRPGQNPVMGFLPQGSPVSVGEIVLTSGLGGRFPKGIPIGQVVSVRQQDFEIFQEAEVRPNVDFTRLELVAVVVGFDPLEFVPVLDVVAEEAEGPPAGQAETPPEPPLPAGQGE